MTAKPLLFTGISLVAGAAALLLLGGFSEAVSGPSQDEDVASLAKPSDEEFAKKLWEEIRGYENWKLKSDVYPGTSPHGDFLRAYATWANVEGESYPVIVKDNFGGEGLTADEVRENPKEHLGAVTIMVQREQSYAPEHGGWYWVKYQPGGEVAQQGGKALAGKVSGCVDCHAKAQGDDYIFMNDEQ